MAPARRTSPATMLDRALPVFRETGYSSTSMRGLCSAMGVTPPTIYADFGDKAGLYTALVRYYTETVVDPLLRPLEGASSSLDELEAYLRMLVAAPDGDDRGPGCLVANSLTELPRLPVEAQALARRHLDRQHRALARTLANARRLGDLRDDLEVEGTAVAAVALVQGLLVLSRGGATHDQLRHAVAAHVASLRA